MFILFPTKCSKQSNCSEGVNGGCLFLRNSITIDRNKYILPIPQVNNLDTPNLPIIDDEHFFRIEVNFTNVSVYIWNFKLAKVGNITIPTRFIYDQVINELQWKYQCPFVDDMPSFFTNTLTLKDI